MQVARDVGGVYYLPRKDGVTNGIAETFRLETSLDGMNWQTAIENGRFDNIRNNPLLQEMRFSSRKARYFRFTVMTVLDGGNISSAAEIGLLNP